MGRLILGLITIVMGFSAGAEEDPNAIAVLKYKFALKEFSVDTSGIYRGGQQIECAEDILTKNIIGKASPLAKDAIDDSQRVLVPSFDIDAGRAAWYIRINEEKKEGCVKMLPYFNGIGLDSLDMRNGRASIYIAAFSPYRPKTDNSGYDPEWVEKDTFAKLDSIFNPEMAVKNITSFPAQCQIVVPSGISYYLYDSELICTLDDDRGYVKFQVFSVETTDVPMSLIRELMDNQQILYGEKQHPLHLITE